MMWCACMICCVAWKTSKINVAKIGDMMSMHDVLLAWKMSEVNVAKSKDVVSMHDVLLGMENVLGLCCQEQGRELRGCDRVSLTHSDRWRVTSVAIEVATHLPSPPEPSPAYPPAAHQRLQQQQHLNSGGPLAAGQGVRAELAHPRMAIGAPVGMVPRLEGPPPGELGEAMPCAACLHAHRANVWSTDRVSARTYGKCHAHRTIDVQRMLARTYGKCHAHSMLACTQGY
eukprot:1158232-Pelagomonas_calceolata.AAC.4